MPNTVRGPWPYADIFYGSLAKRFPCEAPSHEVPCSPLLLIRPRTPRTILLKALPTSDFSFTQVGHAQYIAQFYRASKCASRVVQMSIRLCPCASFEIGPCKFDLTLRIPLKGREIYVITLLCTPLLPFGSVGAQTEYRELSLGADGFLIKGDFINLGIECGIGNCWPR